MAFKDVFKDGTTTGFQIIGGFIWHSGEEINSGNEQFTKTYWKVI